MKNGSQNIKLFLKNVNFHPIILYNILGKQVCFF